ncbi:HAD family phosphatase [Aeromicrobium sp. YIM 150415]|uniref:HAD family phosphatase n=1 Tax=Aeromicrobium piscarium TaxID=2590901 RepID=A0A554SFM8_9ACTN|nr:MULTISPECIES: HAD family phosphatase [Aeromicrobium]MBM9462495.1 HAD family phosphatase [Aeromicrobium sp. YIM 150415]TSD65152.1 HAD family phosphatase [Aeromicrobium piscarium]
MTLPDAVLWDMDGTLIDTEPFWIASEHELAAEHDRPWTEEDSLALVGSGLLEAGAYIRRRLDSAMTPEQIVDYMIGRVTARLGEGLPWRPGAVDLVRGFTDAGIPQALVTMSYASLAAPVMEALGFDVLVSGDAVDHAKPHPEPYLLAARRLGVEPQRCLAIEDSKTGATSANAAGCVVVAVPHAVNVPEATRRTILRSLDGQTPGSLWALASTN